MNPHYELKADIEPNRVCTRAVPTICLHET